MIKIFISHSTQDSELARRLAELFRTAMHLSKSEIRCTSVDGYRLPVGAHTDKQLRREVLDTPILVGLISHQSFESAYVLFELGARWGKGAFMAPVLAHGVPPSILKGPLSALNALSCDSASQIHQLVDNIAEKLDTPLEPASGFEELVALVVTRLPVPQAYTTGDASTKQQVSTHATNGDDSYTGVEEIINRHCETQWKDDYSMRAFCVEQQRTAVERLRSQSQKDIPNDVFLGIRENAANQWPTDFEMRLFTENEQIKAYRKLHSSR